MLPCALWARSSAALLLSLLIRPVSGEPNTACLARVLVLPSCLVCLLQQLWLRARGGRLLEQVMTHTQNAVR